MKNLALFLPWSNLLSWLRYKPFNSIFLRLLWQSIQKSLNLVSKRWKFVWKARDDSHECASSQKWPEVWSNHPTTREMRSFRSNDFSSLTTWWGDCVTCNVHRSMTSWRKKLPCISPVTRSRKEHSGSFNVLNHLLCGLCNGCVWIKKSQHETLEPIALVGDSELIPWTNEETCLEPEHLGKLLEQALNFYIVDYLMGESSKH